MAEKFDLYEQFEETDAIDHKIDQLMQNISPEDQEILATYDLLAWVFEQYLKQIDYQQTDEQPLWIIFNTEHDFDLYHSDFIEYFMDSENPIYDTYSPTLEEYLKKWHKMFIDTNTWVSKTYNNLNKRGKMYIFADKVIPMFKNYKSMYEKIEKAHITSSLPLNDLYKFGTDAKNLDELKKDLSKREKTRREERRKGRRYY